MTIGIENRTETYAATWAVWHSWAADNPNNLKNYKLFGLSAAKECQTAYVAACVSVRFSIPIVTATMHHIAMRNLYSKQSKQTFFPHHRDQDLFENISRGAMTLRRKALGSQELVRQTLGRPILG